MDGPQEMHIMFPEDAPPFSRPILCSSWEGPKDGRKEWSRGKSTPMLTCFEFVNLDEEKKRNQ
jgi:hypothetical protein